MPVRNPRQHDVWTAGDAYEPFEDAGAGGRRASSSRGWRWLQIRVGEVAARIGILRAERRPKCIDVGEREAVGLDIKLPRHRQECFTAKKIASRRTITEIASTNTAMSSSPR